MACNFWLKAQEDQGCSEPPDVFCSSGQIEYILASHFGLSLQAFLPGQAAYMKILESSQTLLHVLKRETAAWRDTLELKKKCRPFGGCFQLQFRQMAGSEGKMSLALHAVPFHLGCWQEGERWPSKALRAVSLLGH